jgi:hypothetical protein
MSLKSHIPLWLRAPRNSLFVLLAALLLVVIAVVSPVQLPVVLYKAALIALAAVIGYWLDRALFPYARPDSFLWRDWRKGTDEPEGDVDYPIADADYMAAYCTAQLRRAVVVGCVVLGVAAGL